MNPPYVTHPDLWNRSTVAALHHFSALEGRVDLNFVVFQAAFRRLASNTGNASGIECDLRMRL